MNIPASTGITPGDSMTARGRKRARKSGMWLRLGAVAVLAASAAVGISCARRPVKVRWNLKEGKTYVYRQEVTGTWRLEGWEMGERSGKFGNLLETRMKVLDVTPDSAFRIREEIELIREGQEFEPTKFEFLMAPSGRLYEMSEVIPGTAIRHIESRATRRQKKQYFEQTQPAYPDRKLKPGDTWIQETKVVLDYGVMTAHTSFEVTGWEEIGEYDCLRIDYQGESYVPYEPEGRNLLDKNKVRGSIWFAPDEGLLIQQQDSFHRSTARITPPGEKPPSTYVVQSNRIYKLTDIR